MKQRLASLPARPAVAAPAVAVLAVAVLAVATLALAGCARHFEAQRVPAPGGGVEATLWASELHGDRGYEVHVVAAGAAAGSGPAIVTFEGVVRRGEGPGVRLQWLQPDLLLVHYADARGVGQSASAVDVAGRHVRVELEQGSLD